MMLLTVILYLLGSMLVIATVLPMWHSSRWWVRICDFPRFQIAVVAIGLLAVTPLVRWPLTNPDLLLLCAVALSAFWQLSWIWRYLPGAPREVPGCEPPEGAHGRIALLTTNVFQRSRDSDALLKIIRDADPDLILAVETDEWWTAQLEEALSARYPHSLTYPLSNGYGLGVFSRLELVDPSIRFILDEAIPSIKTGVRLRSGAVIDLYGLHPQPPAPLQDSTERDVELVLAGMEIKSSQRPSILLGDLNDVAWSPTTIAFKRAGSLMDPRCGRGFFNTYPAGVPGLRYPLDYVFHTRHFAVCGMRVLPRFQSDHLPLIVTLYLQASSPHARNGTQDR